jgi:hypothetical protein
VHLWLQCEGESVHTVLAVVVVAVVVIAVMAVVAVTHDAGMQLVFEHWFAAVLSVLA